MRPIALSVALTAVAVVAVCFSETSIAASDYSTFKSFYQPSSVIDWPVAIIMALIAGAVIVFTGGIASPLVVGMGSAIGSMWGFTGIAATNFGLAMLGGGSIAAGGFGIIGGTVLLTAALSFGTNIVIDYTIGKAVDTYQYSTFVSASKNMTTLPLPKNNSGPVSYEAALEVLGTADPNEPLSNQGTQSVIRKAIETLTSTSPKVLSAADRSREQTLLALLYFVSNDYASAQKQADAAYGHALAAGQKATMPAFIVATSLLYEERPAFNKALLYLNYSITNEPDNALTPLLFAIFLDRMMYRFNDGYLRSKDLSKTYDLSKDITNDHRKSAIQVGLLSRYFIRLKLAQQEILSLTRSSNRTIKESPQTLKAVKAALGEYETLLSDSRAAISEQSAVLEPRFASPPTLFDKVRGNGIKDWEIQWRNQLDAMGGLWYQYSDGTKDLQATVNKFEQYQAELARVRSAKANPEPVKKHAPEETIEGWGRSTYLVLLMLAALIIAAGYYRFRKRVDQH